MALTAVLLFCLLCSLFPTTTFSLLLAKQVNKSLEEIPHDEKCFTQGLSLVGNILYESCGLYGRSSLRKVDMKTGRVLSSVSIDRQYFAEGSTVFNNTIYLLTWKQKKILLFDGDSLRLQAIKSYETPTGEGWGLTTDGKHLIVSDGSDTISFFRIPSPLDGKKELELVRHVRVFDPHNDRTITHINELEFAHNRIYSNIWYKDVILQINPEDGVITQRYDLTKLYPHHRRTSKADCLNGIAYDPRHRNFLLTGKFWPNYFRVRLFVDDPPNDL
eukprot:gene9588-10596_t